MSSPSNSRLDAVIIGGGPAGSSAGTILAQHGRRVLILEREKFPRYHIGESLAPFAGKSLERLGMIPTLKTWGFQSKKSMVFVEPDGSSTRSFPFDSRYDSEALGGSWQVRRAEFDRLLLRNAAEKGAEVREEWAVTGLLHDEAGAVCGVLAENAEGQGEEIHASLVIDATGKEAFSSNRLGWRVPDTRMNKVAVWSYYKGARREQGQDEGATTVAMIPEKGWLWCIPKQDDVVSVGVVADGKYLTREGCRDAGRMLEREIAMNPWMRAHLAGSKEVGVPRITTEISKHSKHCAAPGLLLVGDALAFPDPVFSSGILLALKSGILAGDAVHEALAAGDVSPACFSDYGEKMRRAIGNARRMAQAFYAPDFSLGRLLERFPDLQGPVMDCLAGDLDQDFSGLWSRLEELMELPAPMSHGLPQLPRATV